MATITDILALAPQARALKAADMLQGAAMTYPALTTPFTYPVRHLLGGYGAGQPVDGASIPYILAQGLDEHNNAVAQGIADIIASWWPETDTQPRGGNVPASVAVSDVQIMPDNSIVVRFGNKGKFYTYKRASDPRQASELVSRLMSNPAGMGRAIANGTKRHFTKGDDGVPDIHIGSWRKDF